MLSTNTPHRYLNVPPVFSSNDAIVCHRGTQKKYQQFLKTGSVSQKIKRCWRSKQHPWAPITTTAPPPSSPTTLHSLSLTPQAAINFAPTQPSMDKSQFLNSNYSSTTNYSHSISPPVNLCVSPTTTSRVPTATKPMPNEELGPQSLLPGMHFWQSTSLQDPSRVSWSFHKHDGSEEYIILKETADPNYNFITQDLKTGEEFDMQLTEHNHKKSKY